VKLRDVDGTEFGSNIKGDAIFMLLEYEDNTVTEEYHFVDDKEHTSADW
jgi:hypothetical protein